MTIIEESICWGRLHWHVTTSQSHSFPHWCHRCRFDVVHLFRRREMFSRFPRILKLQLGHNYHQPLIILSVSHSWLFIFRKTYLWRDYLFITKHLNCLCDRYKILVLIHQEPLRFLHRYIWSRSRDMLHPPRWCYFLLNQLMIHL